MASSGPGASAWRTLGFATAVCVVCATVVSASAVLLQDRQRANEELDRRRNVLLAAGLVQPHERPDPEQLQARFEGVEAVAVELSSGRPLPYADPDEAAEGRATVYEVRDEHGVLRMVVLPVQGQGLWSTIYGYLCLQDDLRTICGLSVYRHGETPGLGGEIENPRWQARWVGRQALDAKGVPRIEVAKGPAGTPEADPFRVDGISGATITCRGMTDLVHLWLGERGFGPYLRFVSDREGA